MRQSSDRLTSGLLFVKFRSERVYPTETLLVVVGLSVCCQLSDGELIEVILVNVLSIGLLRANALRGGIGGER